MVLYNQRLGNNLKEQNKTNIKKRGIIMKKFEVSYENYNVLFGNNRFSVIVEAETEKQACEKVYSMKSGTYATGNYSAKEVIS